MAALIERFRWAEPISALSRFHPDLRARVAARLAAAQAWYDDLKAAARRLDDAGAAARLTLRPPARTIDPKTLSPGVLQALQACVAGAQRFGPLLGGLIDPEATERLAQALRVDAAPIDPLAYVGVAGSRLPDGARWAIALSAMYTDRPARDRRDPRAVRAGARRRRAWRSCATTGASAAKRRRRGGPRRSTVSNGCSTKATAPIRNAPSPATPRRRPTCSPGTWRARR